MLKEISFKKKPFFIETLEKNGGINYKVYEYQHLTVISGKEKKKKNSDYKIHITVNSKKRYGATDDELNMIAKEILKETPYKIKKSFFMRTVAHIYEI